MVFATRVVAARWFREKFRKPIHRGGDIYKPVEALANADLISKKPMWVDIVKALQPLRVPRGNPKKSIPEIKFPEDPFRKAFNKLNPGIVLPVSLIDDERRPLPMREAYVQHAYRSWLRDLKGRLPHDLPYKELAPEASNLEARIYMKRAMEDLGSPDDILARARAQQIRNTTTAMSGEGAMNLNELLGLLETKQSSPESGNQPKE
eukprot:Clim_evm4s97 gene=Clim_evmTU4s97